MHSGLESSLKGCTKNNRMAWLWLVKMIVQG